jgi:hypothetical protein
MSDRLPPLPPGASLSPNTLPPMPKGATTQAPPDYGSVQYTPEGIPLQLPEGSEEPTGMTKAASQFMTGVAGMPIRFGMSLAKPILGGAQMVSKMFEDKPQQTMQGLVAGTKPTRPLSAIDQAVNAVNMIDKGVDDAAGPFSWVTTKPASLAGDIVPYVVGGIPRALTGLGLKLLPNAPRVAAGAQGALGGASSAVMQPTEGGLYGPEFWAEKGKQGTVGAVVGGGTGYALGSPVSQEIERLRKAGVTDLTPGMMSGLMKNVEDFTTKYLPFVGGKVQQAQGNALNSFNYGAAKTVLDPLKIEIPKEIKTGYELNNFVKKSVGDAYDNIAPKISLPYAQPLTPAATTTFKQDLEAKVADLSMNMSTKSAKLFKQEVMPVIKNAVQNGTIDGKSFRELESTLGTKAMDYVSSKEALDRTAGRGIFELQNFLRQSLRDANPAVATELTAIHKAFINSLPYKKATQSAAAVDGVIDPSMLRRTTKNLEGLNVPMRDYADAAVKVMGKKVVEPNTQQGTRAIGLGLGAAPAVATQFPTAAPFMLPGMEYALPATVGAVRGLYSRPGVAAANLISQTSGGKLGTAAGTPAGALTSFSEDMRRRKEEQGLIPQQ